MVCRVVEACLQYTAHLGALVENVLRGAKAPAAQVHQLHRNIASAIQAMAGDYLPKETTSTDEETEA